VKQGQRNLYNLRIKTSFRKKLAIYVFLISNGGQRIVVFVLRQWAGSREQGSGSRGQGAGSRKQG
jgi:hypothetical protein